MLVNAPMRHTAALAILSLAGMSVAAQEAPDIGFVSVGRAAPLEHDVNQYEPVGASTLRDGQFIGSARAGQTPPGIEEMRG